MNNRAGVFENGEARRLFASFAAFTAVILLVIAASCAAGFHTLKVQLYQRECSVAGQLIQSGCASDTVLRAFTGKSGDKTVSAGADTFEKAGYTETTVETLLPFLSRNSGKSEAEVMGAAFLLFALMCAACYRFLLGIYRRVDDAGRMAEQVGRGARGAKLEDGGEGAFARMNHAFNEMAAGVDAGFEKLNRQRMFLKNLISDISHQLKTPLSALKMYNEIVLQEGLSGTALDFTKKSGEQLERMEWLILGLLKMARVEAGFLEMNLRGHNLRAIAEEAAADFELKAKEKNICLSVLGRDDIILNCDADWLKEALENVLKNCMEYTPDGGKITVEIERTLVMASVTVKDTGRGIRPDELPYVFQRFYRGRASRSAGSGIGLSLAKSITEQMGGTLTAGGKFGSGAEFTFSFPGAGM